MTRPSAAVGSLGEVAAGGVGFVGDPEPFSKVGFLALAGIGLDGTLANARTVWAGEVA